MRKLLLLPILLMLSGCLASGNNGNPGVEPIKIPPLPTELATKAERLPYLTNNTMGGRELDGAETDTKYNSIALQLNTVISIYQCVEKSINNKENPNNCFN